MPVNLAAARRIRDNETFYMIEPAIDVGCGVETVGKYYNIHMDAYDRVINPKYDANYIKEIGDSTYSCVHSSHCLEHMIDPYVALKNLIRISNKYIIITIPDEEMYEHNTWPSMFNDDHKWSFTFTRKLSFDTRASLPKSIAVPDLLASVKDLVDVKWCRRITEGWKPTAYDMTSTFEAECAIEILLEKKNA